MIPRWGALRDRYPRVLSYAAPVLVGLFVFSVHWMAIPAQGLTDDDDFYAPAAMHIARWLKELVADPLRALSATHVDAAFAPNHEHPPFAKFVFGVAYLVAHEWLGLRGALDAVRVGNAVFAAALFAAMVAWTWRPLGPLASLSGALLLLSLPRFFFHSEVATLDVPVATMIVLVTALFSWTAHHRRRAILTGVVAGLACLTKLNAPFALVTLAGFALLERWRGMGIDAQAGSLAERPMVRLPSMPSSLLSMAVLTPVVFVVGWPWLWNDTWARLSAYVAFHWRHYPILLFFEGEIWEQPYAPGRASVILGFSSMPLVIVVLGAMGAVRGLMALLAITRAPFAEQPKTSAKDHVLALATLQAAVSIGVVALSAVPRYGGEKLFLPFFPFFCLLAGQGVAFVVEALCAFGLGARRTFVTVVVVVLAAGPGFFGTARFFGGFALSYYGEVVGGLRGAVARGYERTYYDVADKELALLLATQARGQRVHFAPNHKEYVRTYRWLVRDGVIPRDAFALVAQVAQADVVVLTHERRWSTYPGLWRDLRHWPVVADKRIDGVPLWTVHRRPGGLADR